ncbi:MAG: pentapeptide repeat-containing protein [Desulfobacteraceae bacterium]|jgi:uncharacterized protein YjbI with pentapeptide repeats
MANHKHVEMLAKGVTVWNRWRAQDLEIKPNLSGTNLFQADLSLANLRQTDLRKTDLRESKLNQTDLFKADLRNANLRGASAISSDLRNANLTGAHMITADLSLANLQGADMRGVRLDRSDMHEANLQETNLSAANLYKTHLLSANLMSANLRGCNLEGSVLMIANLDKADLSLANLTGAKLYGTERDGWKIDGVKCEYAYWDGPGNQRSPADRDYKPGEFELLYRKSPTLEFPFEGGFSPIQAILMDRVVKAINLQQPEFELHLDSLILRGVPRAVFSVLHPMDRPKALALINEHFQEQMQQAQTREAQQYLDQWAGRAQK